MKKYKSFVALAAVLHAAGIMSINTTTDMSKSTYDIGFEQGFAQLAVTNPYSSLTQPWQHDEWERGYKDGYAKSKTQEV